MTNEVVIERPIEEVFNYVTTAEHWKEWHPNTVDTEGADDHSALVGEEIIEHVKVGSLEGGALFWEVSERVEPNRWQIVGDSSVGSIHLVITYTLSSTASGATRYHRELVYEAKKTLLNLLFNRYVLEPYMRRTSEVAVNNIKKVLESQPAP